MQFLVRLLDGLSFLELTAIPHLIQLGIFHALLIIHFFHLNHNSMDYFLTLEHWTSIVRKIKDEELEYDVSAYKTGQLAKEILTFIRSSRFRQALLFREKRGEEYERFVEKLNILYDHEAVKRILANDEFWEACFSLRSS